MIVWLSRLSLSKQTNLVFCCLSTQVADGLPIIWYNESLTCKLQCLVAKASQEQTQIHFQPQRAVVGILCIPQEDEEQYKKTKGNIKGKTFRPVWNCYQTGLTLRRKACFSIRQTHCCSLILLWWGHVSQCSPSSSHLTYLDILKQHTMSSERRSLASISEAAGVREARRL